MVLLDHRDLVAGRRGRRRATRPQTGTARLWNLAAGRQLAALPIGSGGVDSVAFSPDGKTLATGVGDGTAWLWNVATGQQIGNPLTGGSSTVNSVAFSPDGKTLATGDGDGARLWNVGYLVDVRARLCSQVGNSLIKTEWDRYVPPGPAYRNVCAQHP